MTNQPEFLCQKIIDSTLQELEDSKRLSGERLVLSRNLVTEFIAIAGDMLTMERQDSSSKDEQLAETAQSACNEAAVLELFAIGLLKAIYLVEEALVSEDVHKLAIQTIAMDIYEEAQRLLRDTDYQNDPPETLPTEQQKELIRQKTVQNILSYLKEEPKQPITQPKNTKKQLEPGLNKGKASEKSQPEQLIRFYKMVSTPITSVLCLIEWCLEKGTTAKVDNHWPADKELVLYDPIWFVIAWAGPFFVWAIYNLYAYQLLPYAPLLPVAAVTILWLCPFVRQGLFYCTAEALLLVVLLNTTLLVSNWFEPWMMGLLQFEILAGCVFGFALKQDINKQLAALDKIKEAQSELINPNRFYEKLGVDPISLLIGSDLLAMADPDQGGELVGKMSGLRTRMTEHFGFILPNIRVMDSVRIAPNEYHIWVRGNIVARGCLYPGRYMLTESAFTQNNLTPPQTAIKDIDPIYGLETAYWLQPYYIPELLKNKAMDAVAVLIEHLQEVAVRQVDRILTPLDCLKLVELVRQSSQQLVQELIHEKLDVVNLRLTFVNLLREKVSIKDVILIFERLLEYTVICQGSDARMGPDTLSEHLRRLLGRQICLQHANQQMELQALELSDGWDKTLSKHVIWDEFGVRLDLKAKDKMNLIESVKATLHRIRQNKDIMPVLLCPSVIRLPLFRLLESHIPRLVVMSYDEMVPEVVIVVLDTI